ncbi:MAG: M28 family peptidase [Gemmatimonadales bacterium]|nr:MAG: M28 family peptidase [Gemmatimonadales bacterium]
MNSWTSPSRPFPRPRSDDTGAGPAKGPRLEPNRRIALNRSASLHATSPASRWWARIVPLLALLSLAPACGPDAPEAEPAGEAGEVPASLQVSHAVLQEIALRSVDASQVSANADVLLDEIGARISALPSGEVAEAFVEERLESYGVPRVQREPFELLAWDRREASLEIVSGEEEGDDAPSLNILSLGHVGSHVVEASVVDAGFGTAEEIEALGGEVEGAIVLADVGQPSGYGRGVHRTEKITLATEAGAAGFIQLNTQEGPRIPVGVATMGDESTEIPAVAADRATGEHLRAVLEQDGELVVRLHVENWMERSTASNIIGEIPGETDEVVLVGAHLDSWDLATGALDNGSGTLAVLDMARTLAAHVERTGQTPRRTIRFAFWMGEELGLYGSIAHVDGLSETSELDRYAAILNLDVVGAPTGLGAMGRPEAAPLLSAVREALVAVDFELDPEHPVGGGIYSDHQPFLLEGIPVVTLQSRQRPEASGVMHTMDDVRDVLDERGIARSAAVSAALLWALAMEESLPMARWGTDETGERLEELGVRDPLERAGNWRW